MVRKEVTRGCPYCYNIFTSPSSITKYCSIDCSFESKYIINLSNNCWEWKGHIQHSGIICIKYNKKIINIYKYTYNRDIGKVLNNSHFIHKCENKKCVNPEHLLLVNRSQLDIYRGNNPVYKINHEIANKIRNDNRTYKEIADDYNICIGTVESIRKGKNWNKLNEDTSSCISRKSKLNIEQVKMIKLDKRNIEEIAKDYGVFKTTIWKIKNNKIWKNV